MLLINIYFGIVGVEAGSGPGHGQLRGDEGGGADPAHRSLRLLTYQGNPACTYLFNIVLNKSVHSGFGAWGNEKKSFMLKQICYIRFRSDNRLKIISWAINVSKKL